MYLRDGSNYLGGKQKDAAKNNVDIINDKINLMNHKDLFTRDWGLSWNKDAYAALYLGIPIPGKMLFILKELYIRNL